MKPIFIVLIVLGVVILGCLFLAVSYVKAPPDTAYIITGPRKQRTLIGKASVGEGGGASVDLSNYYTKAEVDSLIPDTSRFITEVPAEYVTETELNAKGYLTSVAWGDITGKPTLATVATSGSYNDLIDKPTIPTTANYLEKDTFKPISWTSTDSIDSNTTYKLKLDADPIYNNQYRLKLTEYNSNEVQKDLDIASNMITMSNKTDGSNYTYLSAGSLELTKGGNGVSLFSNYMYLNASNKNLYYNDIATTSDVSTAISNQTKETWTFTLEDGTTVTKSVVLG